MSLRGQICKLWLFFLFFWRVRGSRGPPHPRHACDSCVRRENPACQATPHFIYSVAMAARGTTWGQRMAVYRPHSTSCREPLALTEIDRQEWIWHKCGQDPGHINPGSRRFWSSFILNGTFHQSEAQFIQIKANGRGQHCQLGGLNGFGLWGDWMGIWLHSDM